MLPTEGKRDNDVEPDPPAEKRKITEQTSLSSNLELPHLGESGSSETEKMKMESRSPSKSGRRVSFMTDEKDKPVPASAPCSSVKEHLFKREDRSPSKQPSTSADRSTLRSNWHERKKREERSPVHSKKRTSNQ